MENLKYFLNNYFEEGKEYTYLNPLSGELCTDVVCKYNGRFYFTNGLQYACDTVLIQF